jgi:dolichol-phosphate mannosyltransferase
MSYLDEQGWSYELVFVDDGSTDDSLEQIRQMAGHHDTVRLLSFSRNFGKEAATTAGIHEARGQAIVMYDADGQFPYRLIGTFVKEWQNGAEVVIGVRKANQKEGWVKRYGSKVFYRLLNWITDNNSVAGSTDFRLIDRQVAEEFKALTERNRITRGLIDWLGFKRSYVPFTANARNGGRPGYTYNKLFGLAFHTFVSQSTRPLMFTGVLGTVVMGLATILGIFMVVERYVLHDPLGLQITGTAILAVFLTFLVGVVLGCQGLLALYIESIHNETQNRPLYVVRKDK